MSNNGTCTLIKAHRRKWVSLCINRFKNSFFDARTNTARFNTSICQMSTQRKLLRMSYRVGPDRRTDKLSRIYQYRISHRH